MNIKKIINAVSTVLFTVAIVLWFTVPAISSDLGIFGTLEYSFIDLAFGRTHNVIDSITYTSFNFSVLNFLPLAFLIFGAAISILKTLEKPRKKSAKNMPVAILLLSFGLLAAIGIFFVKNFVSIPNVEFSDNGETLENFVLTAGAYTTIIFAGLAGFSGVLSEVI